MIVAMGEHAKPAREVEDLSSSIGRDGDALGRPHCFVPEAKRIVNADEAGIGEITVVRFHLLNRQP